MVKMWHAWIINITLALPESAALPGWKTHRSRFAMFFFPVHGKGRYAIICSAIKHLTCVIYQGVRLRPLLCVVLGAR
jgi:hypothetical protein